MPEIENIDDQDEAEPPAEETPTDVASSLNGTPPDQKEELESVDSQSSSTDLANTSSPNADGA